jgi:hypothetical protein
MQRRRCVTLRPSPAQWTRVGVVHDMERPAKGKGPPDSRDSEAFEKWLSLKAREWSVVIAARTALRVLPLMRGEENLVAIILPVFRATAIARFAAKYPNRVLDAVSAASAAHTAVRTAASILPSFVGYTAGDAAHAVYVPASAANSAAYAAADSAAAYADADSAAGHAAVKHDAQQLHDGATTPAQLAAARIWPIPSPPRVGGAWQRLAQDLRARGDHWSIWIDWYDDVLAGAPYAVNSQADDAAFTDIPGQLPWDDGPEVVNTEIARRLAELRRLKLSEIPDQSPAPVRVEERDGRVSKTTDRDSALGASERDFRAWRDPVVDHIDELAFSDFAAGTNHSRVRDRLTALGKLLPGEIADVKDRQFRIGYEIERFEGLMAAYRSGGEDMPALNAAQLEDLDRLRVVLKMGIDKLERWSEFRKQASESTTGEADADREAVGDALDEMAAVMEQRAKYFDPEVPATFRFLADAMRDPSGATRTVVYGAVKSAENVVGFLGQRALGIGRKGAEAVETHISKAVAASLIAGLGTAALRVSGALPEGWAWLKPLLAALGVGG